MSFRKRSEVISAPGNGVREVQGGALSMRGVTGAVPARGVVGVTPPRRAMSGARTGARTGTGVGAYVDPAVGVSTGPPHPGIRPSTITSQPTLSTGTTDLDKLLLHQGLPLGTSLLLLESGTTDFSSVLLRVFAAQGIHHNRLETTKTAPPNTHVIVIGQPSDWGKQLPGLYKGSRKDLKKANILEQESKVSVANLTDTASTPRDLKIAWRYGLNEKKAAVAVEDLTYPDYYSLFDITSRMIPTPTTNEITYIPLSGLLLQTVSQQLEATVKHHLSRAPDRVVRIVLPGLLGPSLYPPHFVSPLEVLPFMHRLRALVRRHPTNVAAIASLALDLYPKDSPTTVALESLADGVVHLQPFNQDMAALLERSYKNDPTKIQHGLVHVCKLPVVSDRGAMEVRLNEYAFKNGKKKFEIEKWGIPVEDEADGGETSAQGHEGHDHGPQTTKNIDF